jgi:hypothetical protein
MAQHRRYTRCAGNFAHADARNGLQTGTYLLLHWLSGECDRRRADVWLGCLVPGSAVVARRPAFCLQAMWRRWLGEHHTELPQHAARRLPLTYACAASSTKTTLSRCRDCSYLPLQCADSGRRPDRASAHSRTIAVVAAVFPGRRATQRTPGRMPVRIQVDGIVSSTSAAQRSNPPNCEPAGRALLCHLGARGAIERQRD